MNKKAKEKANKKANKNKGYRLGRIEKKIMKFFEVSGRYYMDAETIIYYIWHDIEDYIYCENSLLLTNTQYKSAYRAFSSLEDKNLIKKSYMPYFNEETNLATRILIINLVN